MFNSIFHKVLVFLRLRKEPDLTLIPLHEIRPFWDFQIFDTPDHSTRSRLVDAYYAVWRFFHYSPWGNPRQAYREIVWFVQRGRRGWADRDIWSLDHYLSSWMPDALRKLKKDKQGVPSSVFEPEDCIPEGDWQGNPSEEGMERASARWDAIIDKMIAAFEADRNINSGLYEEELGPYPMDRPSGVSAETWEKVKHDRFVDSQLLAERDKKIVEEGMLLFARFYNSLWD